MTSFGLHMLVIILIFNVGFAAGATWSGFFQDNGQ